MPILTLQRRLREAGRIRIGAQVAASNGRARPTKLETFRLTSSDQEAIAAAAELYGGEPHPWKDAPIAGTWEVFTTSNVLPVVVPPAATAFSQWFETWSGGGCTRRCDGERMVSADGKDSDELCMCGDPQEGTCKPTTRLNVILKELPGLGVWRLESHGWYAATELAGTVEVCMAAATRGQLLPAVLRLEQREVRRVGEPMRKFAVPILDVQMRPDALGLVVGSSAATAGEVEQGRSWTPIGQAPPPAALGTGDGTTAQQIRNARTEAPKPRRNSAPPLPATGVAPKGLAIAPDEVITPAADSSLSEAQMRKLRAIYGGLDIKAAADQKRISAALLGLDSLSSHSDLTVDQASALIEQLAGIEEGRLEFALDADGNVTGTVAVAGAPS